jgi:ClpP class serine protease
MAWLLKPEVASAMRAGRASGYQPTAEERARFADQMREAYAPRGAERPRNMTVTDGGTAEILVEGVLTEKPDCFALMFGGGNSTYQSIREALALAEGDPAVKNVLLNISSPGGSVTGLFETFAALKAVTKPGRVRTSLAASAAYGIAAASGWPIEALTPATEVGSIGVAARVYVEEDAVDIASTEAPKKRPDASTEEGVAAIREELDALHELFAEEIAAGRSAATGTKITAADVNANFGRGGMFVAKQAKAAGMIDRISAQPKRAPTGKRAEEEEATPDAAPPKDASAADGGAPSQETPAMKLTKEELKAQNPELYAALVAEGVVAGTATERERVLGHLELADGSGDMKTALASIASGEGLTALVNAKHMKAAMRRNNVAARQEETDAAGTVLAGATTTTEGKDLGDQVADRFDAAAGKKPAA